MPFYNYAVEPILDQNTINCYIKSTFSCKTLKPVKSSQTIANDLPPEPKTTKKFLLLS